MCDHKAKLSENDKKLLKGMRIVPWDGCGVCPQRKEVPLKKLRVEEEDDQA